LDQQEKTLEVGKDTIENNIIKGIEFKSETPGDYDILHRGSDATTLTLNESIGPGTEHKEKKHLNEIQKNDVEQIGLNVAGDCEDNGGVINAPSPECIACTGPDKTVISQ